MMITIPISDAIVRQAQDREQPIEEFIEMLIDRGLESLVGRPVLESAMDRIRNLRFPTPVPNK
jgi:hypothetical protein